MKVYLAGPITGHSYSDANSWREEVETALGHQGIKGYSPLRGKDYLSSENNIQDSYENQIMSSIIGINVRDYNDCKTSDAILVNLLDTQKVSIGTCMEIAWARAFQIPCVIIIKKGSIHDHGMLTFGNIIVDNIEDGVDTIVQLLKP